MMRPQRAILKQQLANKLIDRKLFWSYGGVNSSDIPDDVLIEKVLIHLDIEDIDSLFLIFSWRKVREVWLKEVLTQDPLYHSMNILLAFLYFHIKKPEAYIEKHIHMYQFS